MNELELLEVLQMQTLTDETGYAHLLSVPITQFCSAEEKEALAGAKSIALKCPELGGDVLAVINEPVFFANRKEEISTRVFGTFSQKHPKIENIMA